MQQCPLAAGLEGDWRFHLGKEGLLCDAAKQQKQPPHFVPQWLSLLPSMPLLWHRGCTLLYTSSCFWTRICHKVIYHDSFICFANFLQNKCSPIEGPEQATLVFSPTIGSRLHFYCTARYRSHNPPGTTLLSHFHTIAFFWDRENISPTFAMRCLKIQWVWRVRHRLLLVEVKSLVLDLYLGFWWKWYLWSPVVVSAPAGWGVVFFVCEAFWWNLYHCWSFFLY